jgi:hypothetical protein
MNVYRAYDKKLLSMGLWSGGYIPETGQRGVKVMLIKDDEESLKKTIVGLEKVLPFIKPIVTSGYKIVGIFEHTLSENGVFYMLIDDKNSVYKLMSDVYRRTHELKKFNSLESIIKYVQENHWYETKQERSR